MIDNLNKKKLINNLIVNGGHTHGRKKKAVKSQFDSIILNFLVEIDFTLTWMNRRHTFKFLIFPFILFILYISLYFYYKMQLSFLSLNSRTLIPPHPLSNDEQHLLLIVLQILRHFKMLLRNKELLRYYIHLYLYK